MYYFFHSSRALMYSGSFSLNKMNVLLSRSNLSFSNLSVKASICFYLSSWCLISSGLVLWLKVNAGSFAFSSSLACCSIWISNCLLRVILAVSTFYSQVVFEKIMSWFCIHVSMSLSSASLMTITVVSLVVETGLTHVFKSEVILDDANLSISSYSDLAWAKISV